MIHPTEGQDSHAQPVETGEQPDDSVQKGISTTRRVIGHIFTGFGLLFTGAGIYQFCGGEVPDFSLYDHSAIPGIIARLSHNLAEMPLVMKCGGGAGCLLTGSVISRHS